MFFHRTGAAIEDFNTLRACYEKDQKAFSQEFYWQILFDLGIAYKRLGKKDQAKEVWTKLAQITKDPMQLERIQKEKW